MEETLLSFAPLTIAAVSIVIVLVVELGRRRSYKRGDSYEHSGSVETQR